MCVWCICNSWFFIFEVWIQTLLVSESVSMVGLFLWWNAILGVCVDLQVVMLFSSLEFIHTRYAWYATIDLQVRSLFCVSIIFSFGWKIVIPLSWFFTLNPMLLANGSGCLLDCWFGFCGEMQIWGFLILKPFCAVTIFTSWLESELLVKDYSSIHHCVCVFRMALLCSLALIYICNGVLVSAILPPLTSESLMCHIPPHS